MPKIEEVDRVALIGNSELIGICESWLSENVDNKMVEISGYNFYRSDRTVESGKKSGGGLILYHKNMLKVHLQDDPTVCNPDVEMLCVRLELIQTKPIYYGLVYRPPTGNIENYLNHITAVTTLLRGRGSCEINIVGDINIDITQRNIRTRNYLENLKRLGLSNIIRDTTHIKQLNPGFSLIDHFIT